MAWTTPGTAVAGDVLTAAFWNTQVRDNISGSLTYDRMLHVRDQRTAGTNGGALTSGSWQTRVLQTTVVNNITGASLASNQITLPIGTYVLSGWGAVTACGSVRHRFYNNTGTADLVLGQSDYVEPSTITMRTHNHINGIFTLSASSVCELQVRSTTTRAADGVGNAANIDSKAEVFTDLIIVKVA